MGVMIQWRFVNLMVVFLLHRFATLVVFSVKPAIAIMEDSLPKPSNVINNIIIALVRTIIKNISLFYSQNYFKSSQNSS